MLGEPTQIPEKLELVTKIMLGYHGNNKLADFCHDFSENQQFYLVHAKIIYFSFVLCIYTECGNKVAYSKDVLRYHLSENILFPRKVKIALQVCKMLGEPTQIPEKLELVTKIMFGYHGNNKLADFYHDFSENQQFYPVHAKIIYFSFVLSIYRECGNKVACSKDVLRYHLSENILFPRKVKIARPAFCGP